MILEGYKGHGSPNCFLDFDVPVPFGSVADLAVNTLRHVFKATHPGQAGLGGMAPMQDVTPTYRFGRFTLQANTQCYSQGKKEAARLPR